MTTQRIAAVVAVLAWATVLAYVTRLARLFLAAPAVPSSWGGFTISGFELASGAFVLFVAVLATVFALSRSASKR